MQFSNDVETIAMLQKQAEEFVTLMHAGVPFTFRDFFDIRPELHRIRIIGTVIELEELFRLKTVVNIANQILKFTTSDASLAYEAIRGLTSGLVLEKILINEINRLTDDKGNIPDNASEQLSEIRNDIRRKQSNVERRIRQILGEAKSAGWTDGDVEFTIRNGRLVIPVHSADKRKLKGFVHDESSTGQTVFIEPAEIFDTNNEIRELEYAERREIQRILSVFTNFVRPYLTLLNNCCELLGEIDFIRAKATFAQKIKARRTILTDKPTILWKQATHPLLDLALREQKKTIVPLDLNLDEICRILVISGPNAGGKSVCLKTTGLLQYMLQCGLLVPMQPESVCGIFKDIFIDIGDEQSLENDLSTYSSHLLNMKHFLENADSSTLFLIDEFGTGTEPQLGGAIAEAVLTELNNKKSFGVVTTHYANLKLMADTNPGILNAAMLFDTRKLQPLFVLKTGNPGSSFAFEIARKIGFPEQTLSMAANITGHSQLNFEQQLQQLEIEKKEVAKKQTELRLADILLNEVIEKYQKLLKQLEDRKKILLQEAGSEAKLLIDKANRQIELTIKEIKESKADKEKTKKLRENLIATREKLAAHAEQTAETITEIETEAETPENSELSIGDMVRIEDMDIIGELIQLSEHEAVITFNSVKLRTSPEKLQKLSRRELKKSTQQKKSYVRAASASIGADINEKVAQFRLTIDLRGKRVDEALEQVAKYIDEALLLSMKEVSILHGKGNGVLRKVIREFLSTQSQVVSFEDARLESGGHGITQVKLR
ncbi:MAG: endonuclease MutS2 [Bacteroidales bacterium]|nr:endonuclease MutS2 [Bacteroidales bacterium]